MVVPDGFALPPLPYLLILALGVIGVGVFLLRLDPPITDRTVLALTPWMGIGGGAHVMYVRGVVPESILPLLGTPSVYLSTAIVAGFVWAVTLSASATPDRMLGVVGLGGLLVVAGMVLADGFVAGSLAVVWPLVGLVLSIVGTAVLWVVLSSVAPSVTSVTAGSGLAVIFGHVLDAISTAVGVDVLDAGERSPLPRAIMEVAAQLPTADAIGVGWLFVLVKLLVAVGIIWLFVPFVQETERQGHLLLALLAAVGMGPGVHNLLLFMVAG